MFGRGKAIEDDEILAPAPTSASERPAARAAAKAEAAPKPAPAETVSCISSGMTIVGRLVGDGAVKVFGRMEGELQASSVQISEGGHMEGNIVAQDVTIGGRVKGTIHADRVKLNGTAVVEGDVFHHSLVIEENARFEGSSRREDNVMDSAPAAHVRGPTAQPAARSSGMPSGLPVDLERRLNGAAGYGLQHSAE